MPLLDGVGRSSQIGDLTAFFVVAGAFGVVGLLRKQALFLYTPAALLAGAAVFRTIAWLAHGAAFAPAIVLEVVMLGVMVAAVRQLNVSDK